MSSCLSLACFNNCYMQGSHKIVLSLLFLVDAHDWILRFNNAPTQGFEDDVGALTSMRIINSQVATKSNFGFPSASYFSGLLKTTAISKRTSTNSSKAHSYKSTSTPVPQVVNNLDSLWEATRKFLIWDPCNYGSTIEQVSFF